jgi:hypothetical protein
VSVLRWIIRLYAPSPPGSCKRKLDLQNQFRDARKKDNDKCNKEKLDAAFRINHDDKVVLEDTIATVEKWIEGLEADPENFLPTVF